jgi:inorganic triphosphatase YgiF
MQSEHEIPLEREATLLICSDRPETVYQEIASLTAVGAYKLVSGKTRLLEDYYFDTPDAKLRAKKWGLRLRRIGTDLWITLKGPSKQTEWGGRERAEIEAIWSKTSVVEVEAELSRQGIEMDLSGEDLEHSDPMEVMTSAGLVVIQRRDTRRASSAVISGTDGMVQAELDADAVTYFCPETEILHYEVEIESKGPNGPTAVEAIAEYLLAEYSPELKRWRHDKLAAGWAIKELLTAGSLDVNNRLKSAAYDRIDEYLTHELS